MIKSRLGLPTLNKKRTSDKRCTRCFKIKIKSSFSPANYLKSDYRCRKCINKKAIEWQKKNPDKYRAIVLRATKKYSFKQFGVDELWYENKLKEQNCRCAICGSYSSTKDGKRFSIDHSHVTGKNRGLLCSSCNCALGNFKDSEFILNNAISYLKRHQIE